MIVAKRDCNLWKDRRCLASGTQLTAKEVFDESNLGLAWYIYDVELGLRKGGVLFEFVWVRVCSRFDGSGAPILSST